MTDQRPLLPEQLKEHMDLCLSILRQVLTEIDPDLRVRFDKLHTQAVAASGLTEEDDLTTAQHMDVAISLIDELENQDAFLLARAFTVYFHLANLCEETYRVSSLKSRAKEETENVIARAYRQLVDELGENEARARFARLEFHPVFTAHPTEARRRAIETKIHQITALFERREGLGFLEKEENTRLLFERIDAMMRTSPIGLQKPTPLEEIKTIIDIFDHTLLKTVPQMYRRLDRCLLGDKSGLQPPLCHAFFQPGSWIGTDRDGNPNVTAIVSRRVAERLSTHTLKRLQELTHKLTRNLTLESYTTPATQELLQLWSRQKELSEYITNRAAKMASKEPHRAVMLVMAERLKYTIDRNADLMYQTSDEFLSDLKVVQRSLAQAGSLRLAYGKLQDLIWTVETFGFHMMQMEFRQHSVVHTRALEDIQAHGANGERGELAPQTSEVLDSLRALGAIQKRYGMKAAGRYIVSFTKSAQSIADVFKLNSYAFADPRDAAQLQVIPLFEQLEDLENAVGILNDMIKIPEVQDSIAQTGRLEVMLGYSDSSKDAGPTSATLALHRAQAHIAEWADKNGIDVVLFHGRGGAVGRGGGPANRAVLAQPQGSVGCRFKVTEQGEVIFARYGNPVIALRHMETVAAATLLQSAPHVEKNNTAMTQKYTELAQVLDKASKSSYLSLLSHPDFVPWFSHVTPLTEIGLLPIGSRPAKRGLGAQHLDDLRTIPWVFSWSQARLSLAAWYGLGSACEACGNIDMLKQAYKEWPLFTTFIDNVEMSLAKTDERIAPLYLSLGNAVTDQSEVLTNMVLTELKKTKEWVLKITESTRLLENRHVLSQAIKIRSPYVDVLSLMQVHALRGLRRAGDLGTSQHAMQIGALDSSGRDIDDFTYLILCTVSGVAAGLQNTG